MSELEKQVLKARRRINSQRFLAVVSWTRLFAMIAAGIAVAIRKLYPMNLDGDAWNYGWIIGAIVIGFVSGCVWLAIRRSSKLDAAIEIDRRYGLKERVASSLSLAPTERDSEIGKALVNDASRRIGRVDVSERFTVSPNRWSLLPLALGVAVFCLAFFVEDAKLEPKSAQANAADTKTQIKKSTEELAKRMAERKKLAEDKDLPEADKKLLTDIEKSATEVAERSKGDRKKALRKLSDMAKEIKNRKQSIGSGKELKKQLKDLKNIKNGPADRVAESIKDGDFNAAKKALDDLREKLANGELSDKQKTDLQQQMQQMKQRMQQMADAHEQAKQDLEKQIQEKLAQGDTDAANKLQQKLDGMNQQQNQMNQLQQMAENLQQAAESLDSGDLQQALAQMDELSETLDQLQQQSDQLEMLDDALDQIAMAQEAMT